MCRKLSAIVHAPTAEHRARLTWYPGHCHHHSRIIEAAGLDDSEYIAENRRWAKLECVPPDDKSKLGVFDAWHIVCDEEQPPDWWDEDAIRESLRPAVEAMFVRDHRGTMIGGCWIILDGGRIDHLVHGLVAGVSPHANLRGADLSGADLSGANLSGVDLSDAYLSGADLSGANLREADLIDADLSDANLRGADLSEANLTDANLSGADLSGANLSGAIR